MGSRRENRQLEGTHLEGTELEGTELGAGMEPLEEVDTQHTMQQVAVPKETPRAGGSRFVEPAATNSL